MLSPLKGFLVPEYIFSSWNQNQNTGFIVTIEDGVRRKRRRDGGQEREAAQGS